MVLCFFCLWEWTLPGIFFICYETNSSLHVFSIFCFCSLSFLYQLNLGSSLISCPASFLNIITLRHNHVFIPLLPGTTYLNMQSPYWNHYGDAVRHHIDACNIVELFNSWILKAIVLTVREQEFRSQCSGRVPSSNIDKLYLLLSHLHSITHFIYCFRLRGIIHMSYNIND